MGNSKVAMIVQARMGSTRLPGKVALDFGGDPMLISLLKRLENDEEGFQCMVATTEEERDDLIVDFARSLGWKVFRGSESDVLSRFAGAYAEYGNGADVVIRICSDNPLLGFEDVRKIYTRFCAGDVDFLANANSADVHEDGFAVEIFRSSCLKEADEKSTESYDREHVCPWIKRNKSIAYTQLDKRYKSKLSVDTLEDFLKVRKINQRLKPGFTINDVCDLIYNEK
jgi:spore coat polysaccharide biosynthesis protein SpsF (cytidylyltransferase family)